MALCSLSSEIEAHSHVAFLWPAGVAGKEGLFTPGQGLQGETGATVLHGNGQSVSLSECGESYLPAYRRIANCIVQQIAHRPIQAGAVDGQFQFGDRRTLETNLFCRAEALPDPPPSTDQVRQVRRLLLLVCFRALGGHGPQLGHIVLEPDGAVEDGIHHLLLGRRQRVLRQQFRIAADDSQRCFKVVGQRRQF